MSGENIKAAIIGYGNIGRVHAKGYLADLRVTHLGVVEPRQPLPAGEENEKLTVYPTTRDLMLQGQPEVVSICVPHDQHYPVGLEVAQYGPASGGSVRYVLLEKPMALNPVEAAEIEAAFETAGIKLMLAHSVRFSSPFARMAEMLTTEPAVYGEPRLLLGNYLMYKDYTQYPSWKRNSALAGGGVLLRDGIHVLDAVLQVSGSRPVEVWGQTGLLANQAQVEDTFLGGIRFENGTLAQLNFSNAARAENEISLTVHTTKATLKATLEKLQVWVEEVTGGLSLPSTSLAPTFTEPAQGDLWANQMAYFIQCAASGASPRVNSRDGRRVVEIISNLYAAARESRHVQLDFT